MLLADRYWKLPHRVMQGCGPAAVLLAVMADYAGKNGLVFASVETLSHARGCGRRTVIRHIERLRRLQWIEETGATKGKGVKVYRLTDAAKATMRNCGTNWGALPKWFPDMGGARKPSHAAEFVYAVLLSRFRMVDKIEQGYGCADDRRFVKVAELVRATGLTKEGVRSAVAWLAESELIEPGIAAFEEGEFLSPGPCVPPGWTPRR
ncbi:helix-turn-helix domain-containing protein [Alienimonas sp. DA493]|uniref:helix-turn-helix domain-containing protein n=1 Tax=Alienimonas sp. DA493 TaxID=3373605 RepID=UPI00375521E6